MRGRTDRPTEDGDQNSPQQKRSVVYYKYGSHRLYPKRYFNRFSLFKGSKSWPTHTHR